MIWFLYAYYHNTVKKAHCSEIFVSAIALKYLENESISNLICNLLIAWSQYLFSPIIKNKGKKVILFKFTIITCIQDSLFVYKVYGKQFWLCSKISMKIH